MSSSELGRDRASFSRARGSTRAPATSAPTVALPAVVERPALPPPPPRVPPLDGDRPHADRASGTTARPPPRPSIASRASRWTPSFSARPTASWPRTTSRRRRWSSSTSRRGKLLAYASHIEHGDKRDLCAEATAPSASVFKIVTGAALVEDAGLSPDTRQCYSGGEQKILASDIEDDPRRDRWCTTLAGAMGHSTNAVFAKLALHDLKRRVARGDGVAIRLRASRSRSTSPSRRARSTSRPIRSATRARPPASGTRRSRRSRPPWLSATVARGGEAPRLSIVGEVVDDKGGLVYTAPEAAGRPPGDAARHGAGAHEDDGGHRRRGDVVPGVPRRRTACRFSRAWRSPGRRARSRAPRISASTRGSPASRRAAPSRGC